MLFTTVGNNPTLPQFGKEGVGIFHENILTKLARYKEV